MLLYDDYKAQPFNLITQMSLLVGRKALTNPAYGNVSSL